MADDAGLSLGFFAGAAALLCASAGRAPDSPQGGRTIKAKTITGRNEATRVIIRSCVGASARIGRRESCLMHAKTQEPISVRMMDQLPAGACYGLAVLRKASK